MKAKPVRELILFFLLTFFSLSLFFLDSQNWFRSLRGVLAKPILLIERQIYAFRIAYVPSADFLSLARTRQQEIENLKQDLAQMTVAQNQLISCQEENLKIRRLLGAPLPASWQFLPARVISVTDSMRLDKGADQGIKEGMTVVIDNILVGRIIKVENNSSLVELPISTGVKIPVLVKKPLVTGKDILESATGVQARGLLISQPGGLVLDRVLQEEDIQKNDLLVTNGEDWRPNLIIGQISEVLPKNAEIYQKAKVRQLADYQKLSLVFIVIK